MKPDAGGLLRRAERQGLPGPRPAARCRDRQRLARPRAADRVGVTLGLRARGQRVARVFVLVGDGELDEGSNHEAIAFAGRRGLDRLNVVVVDNSSSAWGWPGGAAARLAPGDVALLDTLPDWTVHVPGHADEAEQQLRTAIAASGRVYLRLSLQANERIAGFLRLN